ncbi:MAG: CBS domain-containing protein [Deltaproteobacteria bacterium]|nr:CBS domain-containing protein [Deltaproteobacteria bacterium]
MNPTGLTVKKYMSPAPQTIGREAPLATAKEIMAGLGIRHLPVIQGDKVVGVLSDRDIQVLEFLAKDHADALRVDDAMTRDVYVVAPETPLQDVAAAMTAGKFGSAVVVEGGKVRGIFTTIDALRALAELLDRKA